MTDEMMIYYSGEIKSMGGSKIGGTLVRMSSPDAPDLAGDFFDGATDLHYPAVVPLLYAHGQNATLKQRVLADAKLSKMDNGDIWLEAELAERDQYEKSIIELAKAGKLGLSSGALSHLVARSPAPNGTKHIDSWWVGEASLSVRPAEYKNQVMSLKDISLDDYQIKETKMEQENKLPDIDGLVQAAVKSAMAEKATADAAQAARENEIKSARDAGFQDALKQMRGGRMSTVNSVQLGFSEEKDAVPAFKHWILTGQKNGGLISPPAGWSGDEAKAAMGISGASGGQYAVPDPLYNQIASKRDQNSFARLAGIVPLQTSADHLLIPTENAAMTAFVETAEAAAYNENEPTLAQSDVALKKYTKMVLMSEEFDAYNSVGFDSWLATRLGAAEGVTENSVLTPLVVAGATNSGVTTASATKITIPELTATAGALGSGYNVPGQAGWLMKNASLWYLKGVFGVNYYAFDGLLGLPAYISDYMDAIVAAKKPVIFGNWQYVAMVERPGMVVRRNEFDHMSTGQIALYASFYRGFAVTQAEAFVYLNTAAV